MKRDVDSASRARQGRADVRRATWRGGVATFAEVDSADETFWSAMSSAERFIAVWELARENYGIASSSARGLRGSPHGIRRR